MHYGNSNRTCWFTLKTGTLRFTDKINSYTIRDFNSGLSHYIEGGKRDLTLDFSNVLRAYPNGMLGIISTMAYLRSINHNVKIILPQNFAVRKLFRNVNWAYLLDPTQNEKSESYHDRHLVTRQFSENSQQNEVVNDFMDVILRNMEVPKDIVSALEWSINEITDNVLNHSESKVGGYVQASTHTQNNLIAFAVADSGKGILNSLQEGIPTLRTDLQAIGEAIKSGVTRNPKFGQGNGLAGSLKITTLSGGSFDITSGTGRMYTTTDETKKIQSYDAYSGTIICGQIKMNKEFSISEALDFGQTHPYVAVNIIDLQYEMADDDCLLVKMKNETTGFGSRRSGKQLRTKILNLITSKPDYPIIIDWSGVPVTSSSFADEFMGKLFIALGAMSFSAKIRNRGMEELIKGLLDKAISQRLTQSIDEYEEN